MLASLEYSPLGFWILAFIITLGDSAILLRPGQFLFQLSGRSKVDIRAKPYPFLLRNKELVLTLFVYPGQHFSVCNSNSKQNSKTELRRVLVKNHIAARLRVISFLSWSGLIAICIVGPVTSLFFGIGQSIIAVWSAVYVLAAVTFATLCWAKHLLNLQTSTLVSFGLEFLFCPCLSVNTWKKIALSKTDVVNAENLARHYAKHPSVTLSNISANISMRS